MKRYEEYTPEEIEDLARECERLAEENSRVREINASLIATNGLLLEALWGIRETVLRDLPHSGATPQRDGTAPYCALPF